MELVSPQLEKPNHKRLKKINLFKRIVMILFGAILVAVGLEIFLVPNQIMDGGIVGISMLLSYLTGFKLGVLLFVLNLPFFFLGYKQIGKTFALSTLFGVIVMSVSTYYLHSVPPLTEDPLLAAVFGGIVIGIGVGLVIRYGGSLDGTEILAILFNKKTSFSVGQIVLFFNLFILGSAGFLFGWERAMYSFIAYFIVFKLLDVVIEGFDETKLVWIMSEEPEKLGSCILSSLGRGVTYLSGEGGYTGEYKKVIFCVVTRLEEAKLKEIVEEIDPQAFLAVGNIHEVRGGHFKKRAVH
ncbi:Uncharacterized membrane-anchored protein YitT, contains DUF161 and DUF2179 domains [Thermoactinomyces sp. DSM 45892]|nr:Uncharacterized membrane-anchored protein YitT, contains DUF161 and DUF2179 domains [Thermoactinomyces sp. DSM 45892]